VFFDGVLRWFERDQDTQGPYWKEAPPPLPTARWRLTAQGVKVRVMFYRDDGTDLDPTGRTKSRRIFVDGAWHQRAITTVVGLMPLRTRSGRLKTESEVRADFAHWAQHVKGQWLRKRVAQLVADDDPDVNYPQETALLDAVGQNLPDEINAGADP
jgi:hypothetical protein